MRRLDKIVFFYKILSLPKFSLTVLEI